MTTGAARQWHLNNYFYWEKFENKLFEIAKV